MGWIGTFYFIVTYFNYFRSSQLNTSSSRLLSFYSGYCRIHKVSALHQQLVMPDTNPSCHCGATDKTLLRQTASTVLFCVWECVSLANFMHQPADRTFMQCPFPRNKTQSTISSRAYSLVSGLCGTFHATRRPFSSVP